MNNHEIKGLIVTLLQQFQNNSRRVILVLKEKKLWDLIVPKYSSDGETLYRFMHSKDKECPDNKVKFISYAVGYRYCGPANRCNCAKTSVMQSVSIAQSNKSEEEKVASLKKRKKTNLSRYGVENPFCDVKKIKQSYIKKLGVDNPGKLRRVTEKRKQTNIEKYGVENPAQNSEFSKKQVATWKENKDLHVSARKKAIQRIYGVDNLRMLQWVNDKIKSTNLQKYGTENPSQNQEVIDRIKDSRFKNYFRAMSERVDNKAEPMFTENEYCGTQQHYDWKCTTCNAIFTDRLINGRIPICRKCNPLSVSGFEKEVKLYIESLLGSTVIGNDKTIISPHELDIVIPEKKLAVECNGVFWHGELRGKDRKYHLTKTEKCDKLGYRLIHITDYDWGLKPEIVKSILSSALGLSTTLYARKFKIITIDHFTKKQFLTQHHLQGDAASSVNLALVDESSNIVAVMTFGKSRFNNKSTWEIIRYCQTLHTTVVGGPSKLFKHFLKVYNPDSVISYADRSIYTGTMYKLLNFEFSHYSAPGYKYFSTTKFNGLETRFKFQKHKQQSVLECFNNNLTEWENMKLNKYDRIWDCGNSVWILNNKKEK